MSEISNIRNVVDQFSLPSQATSIQPFGTGNINSTYRVETEKPECLYILQKINGTVFPNPRQIMENLLVLSQYFSNQGKRFLSGVKGYQMPELITSKDKKPFIENSGDIWRLISFIPNTYAVDIISSTQQAGEVGKILGIFHQWTAKLNISFLQDTLPGFHITSEYLEQYDKAQRDTLVSDKSEQFLSLTTFIEKYRHQANILEAALKRGELSLRVMHGDPKISNILFDKDTDKGVAIIDLDTVKPGLIHYDVGDCLRSSCNPCGEETEAFTSVEFDLSLCRSILTSYFEQAGGSLTKNDILYLYDATFLMIYELALRFLTDFLRGDIYFKTIHPQQNLNRAFVQMKLAESFERQKQKFNDLVSDLTTSKLRSEI